jgi:tetratricopeptide (TPR) repeat protein
VTPDLRRADRHTALARLDAELPNVLAVLSWALDQRRTELLLGLLGEWGDYWWHTNRWQDGRAWFDTALEHAPDASNHARARALLYRSRLTSLDYCYEQIHEDLEASLRRFRACNDAAGVAACLAHLSYAEAWRGRYGRATNLGDEAIRFARRAQNESLLAFALALCTVTRPGYVAAARRAQAAVAHLQAVGDLYGTVHTCVNVAYVAIAERRYQHALGWLETALESAQRLGDPHAVFMIRSNQGLARLFLDEWMRPRGRSARRSRSAATRQPKTSSAKRSPG